MEFFSFSYSITSFFIYYLPFIIIISGICVITAKNPVTAVLFLISVFMGVSAYLVLIGTAYLGLVYLIVYVGAIAILFLFVIMMMNLKIPAEEIVEFENGAPLWGAEGSQSEALVERISYIGTSTLKNLPLAFVLGTLFLFEIISVLSLELTKGNLFSKNSGSPFPFFSRINDPINDILLGSRLSFYSPLWGDERLTGPVTPAQSELSNYLVSSDALHMSLNNSNNSSLINLNTEAVSLGFINSPIEENFSSFLQIQSIGQGLYTHTSI
jgi:hypothetical protein